MTAAGADSGDATPQESLDECLRAIAALAERQLDVAPQPTDHEIELSRQVRTLASAVYSALLALGNIAPTTLPGPDDAPRAPAAGTSATHGQSWRKHHPGGS